MRTFKNNILENLYRFIWYYPVPLNISYLWNFGFFAIIILVIQIVSGSFLAMHYVPEMSLAFASVEHIMRDVNGGWAMRYIHANGASLFFIVIYIHILRGVYFQSFRAPRQYLWFSGVALFILLMGTAFLGYLLPWGQMSFWGATVILNFLTVIPVVGTDIVEWVWGGYSVGGPTLNRLYVLHFTLPWILVLLTGLHLILLHEHGSNNPLGSPLPDNVSFFPYSTFKDLFSMFLLTMFFIYLVGFIPNVLGHSDNAIMANPMSTPAHIVPEWYFLPFYAILRSIPDKRFGVIIMAWSLIIICILPYMAVFATRTPGFNKFYTYIFWIFVYNLLILGWIGGQPIVYPYYEVGQIATIIYFYFYIIGIPLAALLDKVVYKTLGKDLTFPLKKNANKNKQV